MVLLMFQKRDTHDKKKTVSVFV